jgi:folate-binding protein YgfZ
MLTLPLAIREATVGAVFGRVSESAIRLSGPDARRFGNGMFTNNLRDLPVGGFVRCFGLDDRGRIVTQLDVTCTSEHVFTAVVDGGAEAFLERYLRYVLFDDVELEATSEVVFTVQGAGAPGVLAALDDVGVITPRSRSPWGGGDLVVPLEAAASVEERLAELAAQVTFDVLEGFRLLAGQARWPADMGAKRLPAELDVRDSHLSFDKGCYIGQESVNRIDVMGKVRRGPALVRVEGLPLADGAAVTVAGKKVGHITSSVELPDGAWVGLAVLRKPYNDPGAVVFVGETAAQVVALPFVPA